MTLLERLERAMAINGHNSDREVARMLGMSRNVIYGIRAGKTPTPLYLKAVEAYIRRAEKKHRPCPDSLKPKHILDQITNPEKSDVTHE